MAPIQGLVTNIANALSNVVTSISNILSSIGNFFGNFFTNLGNTIRNLFVPSDSQFNELAQEKIALKNNLESKLPFVGIYKNELETARNGISQNDFLDITIPQFTYSGGVVSVSTSETNVNNFRTRYEPYRQTIRSFLYWVVIACAGVFIVKHVIYNINPDSFVRTQNIGGGDK